MPTLFLTGSSAALACAIRALYLAEGWSVAGFDRAPNDFLHERFAFFAIDATSESSVESAFTEASERFGHPRALIATIGGVRSWKTIEETPLEDFRFLVDLNLVSFFLAAKHAMKLMPTEGSIISIGALPALDPAAKRGAYAATKAGVVNLTQVLAEEGKTRGVNANCIVPTVIHTKSNEEWGSAEDIPKWTEPSDIAALCFHLTSPQGAAVNGSVIRIPNKL